MMGTHDEDLRVAREPDATLAEHQAWLIAKHDTKVSIGLTEQACSGFATPRP